MLFKTKKVPRTKIKVKDMLYLRFNDLVAQTCSPSHNISGTHIQRLILLSDINIYILTLYSTQVEAGHTILVHAAAGGVGSLLCQWGKALGATVIGTVSTEQKAAHATQDGCDHVIIYTKEDFVAKVNEITEGKGVDVVYDSIGKDTFKVKITKISLLSFYAENLGAGGDWGAKCPN